MGAPVIVDTVAAAAAVDVPPSTIRTWASRGLLNRHGTDRRGRTLYDLQDVVDVCRSRLTNVDD
jgi:DNA-binding transcriptional MerR regulator